MEEKTFTAEDQATFAALSGDFNPIHVDPLAARRMLFGGAVVHGMHLLIWALDRSLEEPASIKTLSVSFKGPVRVGERVHCDMARRGAEALELTLWANGREIGRAAATLLPRRDSLLVSGGCPPRGPCRLRSPQEIMGAAGALHLILDQERLRAVAPSLVRLLPADQLAALLATTRLVGMECPGCRSVYSELRFTATPVGPLAPSAPAQLEWSVKTFDARFSRIEIAASAPAASMRVVSFLRPAQQAQPSYASVKMKVAPNAFVGRCVLVVGGSRGLGELCAKLLGAGGAHVRLTYNVGAGDAQRVVDEIGHGGGHADVIQWDVLSGGAALMQSLAGWQPTYIYYFASPPIFVGSGRFSAKLFGRFCDYYVAGFADLVRSVREVASGRLSVFYPSSIAVDKPPRDMMEYAAAKAAGEVVCRYLESADPGLRIRVVRLPRLPTDQTASLYPADTADPLPLLAEIVTAG